MKTLEGWSLRDATLTRVDDYACRHSSDTDTRSSRSCDNGLWRDMYFSFFTDTKFSQSCDDGFYTLSGVKKLP